MISFPFIIEIQNRYGGCLTKSRQERGCGVDLSDLHPAGLVMLDGSEYQRTYRHPGKLADRLIISGDELGFVCAVEFKSGKIGSVTDVREQIQGGLALAELLLAGRRVARWCPLLLYGRTPHRAQIKDLRASNNKVWFQNERRPLEFRPCGTKLSEVLI